MKITIVEDLLVFDSKDSEIFLPIVENSPLKFTEMKGKYYVRGKSSVLYNLLVVIARDYDIELI